MRSRTFSLIDTSSGHELQDERGIPFAVIRKDPDLAVTYRTVARKAYAAGLADAYAKTRRTYHLRKGDVGETGRSWDLCMTGREAGRLTSVPRSIWPFPAGKPVAGLLTLAQKAYGAGYGDAGGAD